MAVLTPGDATAIVAPDPIAPEAGGVPTLNLPEDTDPKNADSVAQPFTDLANWLAFALSPFAKVASWTQKLMVWRTALKHARAGIDHLGFPGGRIISWEENWVQTFTVDVLDASTPNLIGWTAKNHGTDSVVSGSDPNASAGFSRSRFLELSVGGASGRYAYQTAAPPCNFDAGNHIVFEFDALLETADPVNIAYALGLMTQVPTGSHQDASGYAWFYKENSVGNWFCATRDGSTASSVDSGVASSTNLTRFRIEWHGATVSDNGAQRILFFIDGNLVANKTTNLPIADTIPAARPVFGIYNTGNATPAGCRLRVGPSRFSANLFAADVF